MPRTHPNGGQFALIPASVLYDGQLPATAKLLYGEIYRLSRANGFCFASNRDFTAMLQCSEKTVRRLIASLAERGHIRVEPVRRYGCSGDIIQRRIFCRQEPAAERPSGGRDKNVRTSPQKCPEGTDKNVRHTTKKKNKKKKPPIIPQGIPALCQAYAGEDADLLAALLGFVENREAIRKPVKTERAMNGILAKLDRLSAGDRGWKLALLDKATVANWLTVFPLKEDELPENAGSYDEGGYDGI